MIDVIIPEIKEKLSPVVPILLDRRFHGRIGKVVAGNLRVFTSVYNKLPHFSNVKEEDAEEFLEDVLLEAIHILDDKLDAIKEPRVVASGVMPGVSLR